MTDNRTPFFSIIIPTYNQAQYLPAALDSIAAQTDPDWEVLVVNDGSTDETSYVMSDFAVRDGRIHAIHKENGGVASALNAGLKAAAGEWICWLSSDDMFLPDKLATNRRWIANHPEVRFFFSYFRLLHESSGKMEDHDLWGPLPEPDNQVPGLFYRNYINGITICVNRIAWLEVGQFSEELRYGQDYDMWLRLLARFPATFIPEATVISRHHDAQGSFVFQEACYFDSARAALWLMNRTPFETWFPRLDLNDPMQAVEVVEKALAAAADPGGLHYALGPHPALAARLLEWIASPGLQLQLHSELLEMIQDQAQDLARRYHGTPFGTLWKAILGASAHPVRQDYGPLQPESVGAAHFHASSKENAPVSDPLERYLARFLGMDVTANERTRSVGRDLIIVTPLEISLDSLLDREPLMGILSAAQIARSAGWNPLIVGRSKYRLGMLGDILFIGVEDAAQQQVALDAIAQVQGFEPGNNRQESWQLGRLVVDRTPGRSGAVLVFSEDDVQHCAQFEQCARVALPVDSALLLSCLPVGISRRRKLQEMYYHFKVAWDDFQPAARLKNYVTRPGYYFGRFLTVIGLKRRS